MVEIDKRTINIVMLSIGFMLVFVSFQTMSNILITLLNSVKKEISGFSGDPFLALAIVYVTLAVSNFLVPSIISVVGTRIAMVLGSIAYAVYITSFFIPNAAILYGASFILGVGAAIIWTSQGTYLSLNSDAYTIARHSALFWAAFQCSTLFGNLMVYFKFQNLDYIPADVRTQLYSILSGVCLAGVLILMLLRPAVTAEGEPVPDTSSTPKKAFKRAFSMLQTKNMLLLCISFWFTGALLAFAASMYGASIGFTRQIAQYPKPLIGLAGVLFGLGEVLGGVLFGIWGEKTTFSWGRNPIVIFGCVILLVCFTLIKLNLPTEAPFGDTDATSYFKPPIAWLAVLCSFLLGLGDSCFNTQIYSIVATLYRDDSAPPFAIFKFVQSVASGIAFLYAKVIPLHVMLIALGIMVVLATVTFFVVERFARIPNFDDDLAVTPSAS